jgi:membrane protease YdiL (CAAX protease family)
MTERSENMKITLYLIGPFIMIALGLYGFSNAPVTFLLFYGWMFCVCILLKSHFRKGKRKILLSVVTGVISGLTFFLTIVLVAIVFQTQALDVEEVRSLLGEWGFSGVGLVLVLIFINPVLEEVYWRGIMHDYFRVKLNDRGAALLTSFFYTLYHFLSVIPLFEWPMNVFAAFPVFLAGLFWSFLRLKTGSLVGPIFSHAMADIGILCIYWIYIV